jgi:hypothetical protein
MRCNKRSSQFPKDRKAKKYPNPEQHQPTIFSTTRLSEFLEAELSVKYCVDNLADADESDDFIYLPRGLQEWIASQQYILFEGQSILTSEELMPFYTRYCASSDDELLLVPAISPTNMILELMEMQLKRNSSGQAHSIVKMPVRKEASMSIRLPIYTNTPI